MVTQPDDPSWVLLNYRVPREPSTPRIAIWRKLKELGVAQVGDGLVALPHDARTKEHLEWIAERVVEAEGEAIVWIAKPSGRRTSQRLASELREARAEEYRRLLEEVEAATDAGPRTIKRWRREFRKIDRRDYFRSPGRSAVNRAINAKATDDEGVTAS